MAVALHLPKPYSSPLPFSPFLSIPSLHPNLLLSPLLPHHPRTLTFPRPQTIHPKPHFPSLNRPIPLISRSHSASAALAPPDPQFSAKIRGIFFYSVTAAVAIVLFLAMVVAHPLVLLFDRHRRKAHHFVAKLWAAATVAQFYKVEVEGMENLPSGDGAAVYVSNHQSFLDIYTLLTLGRCFKFISKRSIFLFPVVGWAMYLMGLIPLARMDSRSQLDCLKRCIELLKKGASVFFFPEGTRSKDGKLGVFKKGAFTVAAKVGAPVVPIALIGTGEIMPAGMEGIVKSGSVKVVIHKPIEGSSADVLCNEARNAIADTLLLHGYDVHHYD